ncbi:uncharacterized protein [Rutidosis leptorrhynchoides]|uniref:uncharacterized protein n=1 Tax=Rutidosis leptorrhynchoides TaxID=125765 RepID=UPI003A9A4698
MAEEKSHFQTTCVPKFDGDYDHWCLLMENLLRSKEYWQVIEEGYTEPGDRAKLSETEHISVDALKLKDLKAQNYLFQSIDKHILKTITQKNTVKQIWDAMKMKYRGNARVKRAQLQRLRRDFEMLEMKSGETVAAYFGRVMVTTNDMRNCGETMQDIQIVEKILRTLTNNFIPIVCSIEESKDLDTLTIDELQSSLLVHEQKLLKRVSDEQVLKVEHDTGRGRGRNSYGRGRGCGRGHGRSHTDKSTLECYRCHNMGHFAYECTSGKRVSNYAEFDENEELLSMAAVDAERKASKTVWFLDSAFSNHMTGVKD